MNLVGVWILNGVSVPYVANHVDIAEVVGSTELLANASGFQHGWKPALKTRAASVAPAARFKPGYRRLSRNPIRLHDNWRDIGVTTEANRFA